MLEKVKAGALAVGVLIACTSAGLAQPQTKLTSELDKQLSQAIWCSSLLFEHSNVYEESSEDALRYEDMAFEIGAEIDTVLLEEHGMRQAEVDEIWAVYDDGAYLLAQDDPESFSDQLAACEAGFETLMP